MFWPLSRRPALTPSFKAHFCRPSPIASAPLTHRHEAPATKARSRADARAPAHCPPLTPRPPAWPGRPDGAGTGSALQINTEGVLPGPRSALSERDGTGRPPWQGRRAAAAAGTAGLPAGQLIRRRPLCPSLDVKLAERAAGERAGPPPGVPGKQREVLLSGAAVLRFRFPVLPGEGEQAPPTWHRDSSRCGCSTTLSRGPRLQQMVAPIHWALWGLGAGAASRRCCTEPGAFSGIYGLLLGGGWAVPPVDPQLWSLFTLLETPVWPRAPSLTSEAGGRWRVAQGHQKVTFFCSGCGASRRWMGPGRAELWEDANKQCGLGDISVVLETPLFTPRFCLLSFSIPQVPLPGPSGGPLQASPQDTNVSPGDIPCRG